MGIGIINAEGKPAMDWYPFQGGVEIVLVGSCYRNRDKPRSDEPQDSNIDNRSIDHLFNEKQMKGESK